MRSSKDEIIVCLEEASINGKEKITLKRSLSLESVNRIISQSQESLKKTTTTESGANKGSEGNISEPKRKLSGFSLRLRKMSDTTHQIVRRKISTQPDTERRIRGSSFAEKPRQRKVSVQPDFTIGSVSVSVENSKRRVRKGSLQPNMLTGGRRGSVVKDPPKARKMSVPANMKYNTERVRVRRVSFINQNTGEAFQMPKK